MVDQRVIRQLLKDKECEHNEDKPRQENTAGYDGNIYSWEQDQSHMWKVTIEEHRTLRCGV